MPQTKLNVFKANTLMHYTPKKRYIAEMEDIWMLIYVFLARLFHNPDRIDAGIALNGFNRFQCGLIDIGPQRGMEPVEHAAKADRKADVHDLLGGEMRGQVARIRSAQSRRHNRLSPPNRPAISTDLTDGSIISEVRWH